MWVNVLIYQETEENRTVLTAYSKTQIQQRVPEIKIEILKGAYNKRGAFSMNIPTNSKKTNKQANKIKRSRFEHFLFIEWFRFASSSFSALPNFMFKWCWIPCTLEGGSWNSCFLLFYWQQILIFSYMVHWAYKEIRKIMFYILAESSRVPVGVRLQMKSGTSWWHQQTLLLCAVVSSQAWDCMLCFMVIICFKSYLV